MGLTYTRAELRTLAGQIVRDENGGVHNDAKKNRIINQVHADFVERAETNLNVINFTIANATADGVLVYDKNGTTPTITRVDVADRNYYTISDCNLIDRISRWDDDDYGWKQLAPMTQFEADMLGLLKNDDTRPTGYMMLESHDTFQFLPALGSTGYSYQFEVRYRAARIDLITDDSQPTAAGDDALVPTVPLQFRQHLVDGIVAKLLKSAYNPNWTVYQAEYEKNVERVKRKMRRMNSDQAPRFRNDYRGYGG